MCNNEGARETSEAYVVCTTPDVCTTNGCPVPYSIISYLDTAVRPAESVRMTDVSSLTMDSRLSDVVGDEGGTEGGVSSGVNLGYCIPTTYAQTVRAEGHHLLFHSSEFWMNCSSPEGSGNTKGLLHYVKYAHHVHVDEDGRIVGDMAPPVVAENDAEKDFLAKDAGQPLTKGDESAMPHVAAFSGNAAPKLFPEPPVVSSPRPLYLVQPLPPETPSAASGLSKLLPAAEGVGVTIGAVVLGVFTVIVGVAWPATAHAPTSDPWPNDAQKPATQPEGVRVTKKDSADDQDEKECPPHDYYLPNDQTEKQRERVLKDLQKGSTGDKYVACLASRFLAQGKSVKVNVPFRCKKCKGALPGGQGDFDLIVDGQPYEAKVGVNFDPIKEIYGQLAKNTAAALQLFGVFPHVLCNDADVAAQYSQFAQYKPTDEATLFTFVEHAPCP